MMLLMLYLSYAFHALKKSSNKKAKKNFSEKCRRDLVMAYP